MNAEPKLIYLRVFHDPLPAVPDGIVNPWPVANWIGPDLLARLVGKAFEAEDIRALDIDPKGELHDCWITISLPDGSDVAAAIKIIMAVLRPSPLWAVASVYLEDREHGSVEIIKRGQCAEKYPLATIGQIRRHVADFGINYKRRHERGNKWGEEYMKEKAIRRTPPPPPP